MKRLGILIGLILFLAIFIAFGWYFVSPLFFNRNVDERSPFVFPAKEEVGMIMPPTATMAEQVAARFFPPPAAGIVTAKALVKAMNEPALPPEPASATPVKDAIFGKQEVVKLPLVVAQGHFVDGAALHQGSGSATLYTMLDGSHLLRFENFASTNGPDLHVLLSPNAAPTDYASLESYLDLGDLKGNIGNQNYTLSADIDLSQYKSVVIYSVPFEIIYAVAPLE